MALIKLANLGQELNRQLILKDINLDVERGEVFALIGPTGAGKTTLIRLIDLLDLPSRGRIYFDGIDVTYSGRRRLKARRRMALIQQKPIVFDMSVYDNVACGLRWRHEQRSMIKTKVEKALETVGLADYIRRDAKTLSGGETQRVAIARALVTEPEVLLLDEPTANLDPVSTSKIEDVLENIIRENRTTMLMATHDMTQGQRLAQKIGVIMGGELVQIGRKGEIFNRPLDIKIAHFVGMENRMKGIINTNEDGIASICVSGGLIESVTDYEAGEEVCVCIRPEDITLSFSKTSSSARNVFEGEIKSIVTAGPFANVELDCGFPLIVLITVRSTREMELEIGKHINASFKATAAHIIKG